MALTQSDWTVASANGIVVLTCTVAGETNDTDMMTKRTPANVLDSTKPFTIIVKPNEDFTASGASAVDVWGGYAENCSLAAADVGTGCVLAHANSTDIDAGLTQVIHVFPGISGTVTQVTNASPGTALIAPYPFYIVNIDCTAGLQDAATVTFIIVQ